MLLTIKEISEALHISQSEIQKWVKNELLKFAPGFQDSFLPGSLEKAKLIQNFKNLGYSIEEIKKIKLNVGLPYNYDNENIIQGESFLAIGELADKSGLNTRTIKFWEEKKLIKPFRRTEGGFRLYRKNDVHLLKFIKDLQTFNYTLSEIGNIIRLIEKEFGLRGIEPEKLSVEELEKEKSSLEYLIERMKEIREASHRVENVFSRRLRNVIRVFRNEKRKTD